jgi:uncharacterized membrane protein (UPF0127 family)
MQRDNWGKWAIAVALLVVLIAGVAMVLSLNTRKWPISVGSKLVYARVADTDDSRAKGLSGTSGLGDSEGMLFIFDTPGRWGMWMKDMHYSLDMVWMDSNKKIVYIAENVSPSTYPKSFLPDTDSLYVLELPAGFVAANHVSRGQVVGFAAH